MKKVKYLGDVTFVESMLLVFNGRWQFCVKKACVCVRNTVEKVCTSRQKKTTN